MKTIDVVIVLYATISTIRGWYYAPKATSIPLVNGSDTNERFTPKGKQN